MEETEISARVKYILLTSVVVITTVLSVWLMIRYWREIAELQQYGYLGVFVIAFIAGSSLPTPISYLLVTFTLGGILHPALVGVCAGFGAGIGGSLVFLVGRGGRRLLPGLKDLSVEEQANNRLTRILTGKVQPLGAQAGFGRSFCDVSDAESGLCAYGDRYGRVAL